MGIIELPDSEFTYHVYHTTGTGEQGGEPIRRREFLFATNDKEEIEPRARAIYPLDAKYPGWTYDNWDYDVNTCTPEGQVIKAESDQRWEAIEQDQKDHPEQWSTYTAADGMTISLKHNPIFDGPSLKPGVGGTVFRLP